MCIVWLCLQLTFKLSHYIYVQIHMYILFASMQFSAAVSCCRLVRHLMLIASDLTHLSKCLSDSLFRCLSCILILSSTFVLHVAHLWRSIYHAVACSSQISFASRTWCIQVQVLFVITSLVGSLKIKGACSKWVFSLNCIKCGYVLKINLSLIIFFSPFFILTLSTHSNISIFL